MVTHLRIEKEKKTDAFKIKRTIEKTNEKFT